MSERDDTKRDDTKRMRGRGPGCEAESVERPLEAFTDALRDVVQSSTQRSAEHGRPYTRPDALFFASDDAIAASEILDVYSRRRDEKDGDGDGDERSGGGDGGGSGGGGEIAVEEGSGFAHALETTGDTAARFKNTSAATGRSVPPSSDGKKKHHLGRIHPLAGVRLLRLSETAELLSHLDATNQRQGRLFHSAFTRLNSYLALLISNKKHAYLPESSLNFKRVRV